MPERMRDVPDMAQSEYRDGRRSKVIEWLFAALNSVEAASLLWSIFKFFGDTVDTPR